MNPTPSPASRQALLDNVAFWRSQSERLEADNSKLPYYLMASPMAGGVVFALSRTLWMAAAAAAVLAAFWALGLYMISVRRDEFAFALSEAKAELARCDKDPSAP